MAEPTLVAYAHAPMAGSSMVRHVICVPCQQSWPAPRAQEAIDHDAAVHGHRVPDYPPDPAPGVGA